MVWHAKQLKHHLCGARHGNVNMANMAEHGKILTLLQQAKELI